MSGEALQKYLQDIIAGNRQIQGSQHQNRGPSNLSLIEKALLTAENAALRTRLKPIIIKEIDTVSPGSGQTIVAAIENGDKNAVKKELEKSRIWPLLAGLLLALLALALLAKYRGPIGEPDKDIPRSKLIPQDASPDKVAEILCGEDSGKKLGALIDRRKSDVGVILTETRRDKITQKFIKTKEWKDLVKQF